MNFNPAGTFRQMKPGSRRNFRLDLTAAVLFSVFNVVFNQFFIPIAIRHGADSVEVGLLTAAPAIGLLFAPIWASMAEKRDPKPFMIYPNLIGRLLILLPLLYNSSSLYVVTALLFQLLMGIQAPAYAKLMTMIYPADLRGRLMGNVRVGMGGLMIPLAYGIGLWIDKAGETGPLLAAAVTGVVSILVFAGVKETEPAPEGTNSVARTTFADQIRLLRTSRELVIFLMATTFSGFANMLASPLYQIIQVEHLGLTNAQIGYTRMMYFGCLLLSYLIMGWVIDRYSPRAAMIIGLAAYSTIPLLYGWFGNYASVFAAVGIQGFGDAIWDIGCLAYVFRLAPGREGVVFSMHLLLFGIRGTIGPLLSTGLVHTVPLSYILYGAAACALTGLLLFVVGLRRRGGGGRSAG